MLRKSPRFFLLTLFVSTSLTLILGFSHIKVSAFSSSKYISTTPSLHFAQLERRYNNQKGGKKPGFSLWSSLISRMLNLKKPGFCDFCTDALVPLIQQGAELYQTEQFAEAVTLWQQALKVEQAKENQLTQAMVLNYLSMGYQQLGQWDRATETVYSSLKLIQQLASDRQSTLLFAQALNTQGSLLFSQGQAEKALKTWQQAATIYQKANYIPGRIGSLVNQAQAQQALGFYLQARKTLTGVEQALQNQSDI